MDKIGVAQHVKTTGALPSREGLLQRKCACGNHTVAGGVCAECAKTKGLQRRFAEGVNKGYGQTEQGGDVNRFLATSTYSIGRNVSAIIPRDTEQTAEGKAIAALGLKRFSRLCASSVDAGRTPATALPLGMRARRLDVTEKAENPAQTGQVADDPYCLHTTPGVDAERCEFTPKQQHTLSAVSYAARSLTSQALVNLGRGDTYMTTLAQRIFHVQNPSMDSLKSTLSQILANLRSKPVVCGTCADKACYTSGVVAHVTEDLSTVVLCQRFFLTNVTQMRRTLIHEAGHAAGVDASLGNEVERYCDENSEGCVDPCSNLTGNLTQNVDAWARFIECAAYSG